jgi:formylglycine-generating enzyme required for sulfatase activity
LSQKIKEAPCQEEQTPQTSQKPVAQPLSQVARLEPESTLHRRASVAVPAATINTSGGPAHYMAFQLDRHPVSNRAFLAFVRAYPEWQKSHIAKDLHDGDYLKHWGGDAIIKPNEMELPVRYISYHAALAYCQAIDGTLPAIGEYRVAARHDTYERFLSIIYEQPYQPAEFNFVSEEWTIGTFAILSVRTQTISNKVVVFSSRSEHGLNSYTDKRHTGKLLGFRCVYKEN